MKLNIEQQKSVNKTGRKHHLRYIVIHGSYANGEEKKGSDLDIAVCGHQFIDFKKQLAIHADLADVFGDNRNRELDLKTLHHKDVLFLYEVVKNGNLIYGDPIDYENFIVYVYKKFHDSQSLFRLADTLTKKRLSDLRQSYA